VSTKRFTMSILSSVLLLLACGCTPQGPGDDTGAAAAPQPTTRPEPAQAEDAPQPAAPAKTAAQPAAPRGREASSPPPVPEVTVAKAEVSPAPPSPSNAPRIYSPEPVYDYGSVDNMEMVEHDFVVKNIGEAPLELGRVKTSCGCTAAKPAKTVLAPGEETTIAATLSLKGREGKRSTVITVPSNDPETPNFQLKFTGVAVAAIRVSPYSVNYGQVDGDTQVEDQVLTVQSTEADRSVTVTRVECTSPYFETSYEEVVAGKTYRITMKNVRTLKEGPIVGQVRIWTDDPTRASFTVPIYGSVVGDIVIVPSRISVNYNDDPQARTSQYIRVAAGKVKDFEITEVISPLEEVEVEFTPRKAQFSEYLLKLTNMPANGVLDGKELIVKTDIPGKPEVRIPFINRKTSRSQNVVRPPVPPVRPTTTVTPSE